MLMFVCIYFLELLLGIFSPNQSYYPLFIIYNKGLILKHKVVLGGTEGGGTGTARVAPDSQ